MDESHWKERIDRLESRLLEQSRACARQHVALGQLLDIVASARVESEHHQAPDLLAQFEAILKPYAAWIQKFHRAEWALQDRAPTHPIAEDIPG